MNVFRRFRRSSPVASVIGVPEPVPFYKDPEKIKKAIFAIIVLLLVMTLIAKMQGRKMFKIPDVRGMISRSMSKLSRKKKKGTKKKSMRQTSKFNSKRKKYKRGK